MQEFKVHILGCGSAAPDVMGNHGSCQCVEYKNHYYLFDCGEGTQYQLYKQRIGYNKIDAIFISHLHGDHFLGFIGLISAIALTSVKKNDLHVYAPSGFEQIIRPMLDSIVHYLTFNLIFHVIDKPNEVIYTNEWLSVMTLPANHKLDQTYGFLIKENQKERNFIPEMITKYNIPYYMIFDIKHNHKGFVCEDGTEIPYEELTSEPKKRYSYAYCADGFECPELIDTLRNERPDVVYHEASFLETEMKNAMKYKHSTPQIAATVAKESGAKRLYMGHISARYYDKDYPKFITSASEIFPESYIAEELMTINIKE